MLFILKVNYPVDLYELLASNAPKLRNKREKQNKNRKKVIDDNDLLGFEYDEKVLSDLTSQLQSYIEMNSNISTCIGLNTISSYGSFVCYIMGNSQAKYNIQPKELKELQETTKC